MLIRIDEWVLRQHQAAADWAHSTWDDVSPWLLAKQCFMGAGVLYLIGVSLEWYRILVDGDSALIWTKSAFLPFMVAFVFVIFYESMRSSRIHQKWLNGKTIMPDFGDVKMRVAFGILAVVFISADILLVHYGVSLLRIAAWLIDLSITLTSMGFYFKSCHRPTKFWLDKAIPSSA